MCKGESTHVSDWGTTSLMGWSGWVASISSLSSGAGVVVAKEDEGIIVSDTVPRCLEVFLLRLVPLGFSDEN